MQKINYYLQYAAILQRVGDMLPKPRLLLQACCAPCTSGMIEELCQYFDVTLYFYNPNIDTREEYDFRAKELVSLVSKMGLQNQVSFVIPPYDPKPFEEIAKGREYLPERGGRCTLCYHVRLESTARLAAEKGYDWFCTTLSVSPLKNAQLLNEMGLQLEKEHGVPYLVSDFKKKEGYKRSVENSKKYDLYRQNYCGCKYSKQQAKEREDAAEKR